MVEASSSTFQQTVTAWKGLATIVASELVSSQLQRFEIITKSCSNPFDFHFLYSLDPLLVQFVQRSDPTLKKNTARKVR